MALTYDLLGSQNRERPRAWFTQDFSRLVDEQKLEEPAERQARPDWDPTRMFRTYVQSGSPLRLSGPGHVQSPTWSADGKQISFFRDGPRII